MIAEVGGIVKVSGSRIATPLAPPRPGSTPMMTPSRMPTIIRAKLYQDSATLKPPISEAISSTISFTLPVVSPRDRSGIDRPRPLTGRLLARLVYHVPIAGSVQYGVCEHAQVAFGRSGELSQAHNRSVRRAIASIRTACLLAAVAYGIPETTR